MSSSLAAAITDWSPPSTWPKPDTSRWCWSAARNPAARPSQKNFIPASAAPLSRTLPDRCGRDIVRAMQLEKHGLNMIRTDVAVTALSPDGRALILYHDTEKAAQEIAEFSQKDATKYPQFQSSLAKMGRVIGKALTLAPPDIDNPSSGDLWGMLNTGRALRKLGRRDMYRLLRWGPMAVADLVAEYFETELLRATIAARGIFGTFLGPWSAGSSLVLLIRAAGDEHARVLPGSPAEAWARSRRPWLPPPSRPEPRFATAPKSSKCA